MPRNEEMMQLKAILFDLDGTLGNTLPIVIQALQDTFQQYSHRFYTAAEITAMFGPTEEGVIFRRVDSADSSDALKFYLARYAALHAQAREPFPGVVDLLTLLQTCGIRRGVVTGKGPDTAKISMNEMGLAPHIELLLCGSDAGAEKPRAIRQALQTWQIPPEQAAYLGDVPYDLRAATEAGVHPLGAAWAATSTLRPSDGANIFSSVADLQKWLIPRLFLDPHSTNSATILG